MIWVRTDTKHINTTGDQLLAKKSHRELLAPYEDRAAAAERYLKAVRPGLTVQTGALLDPKVGCCEGMSHKRNSACICLTCWLSMALSNTHYALCCLQRVDTWAELSKGLHASAGAHGSSDGAWHAGAGGVQGDRSRRRGHPAVQAGFRTPLWPSSML